MTTLQLIGIFIIALFSLSWCVPQPPGILGALIEYYLLGGKQRALKKERTEDMLRSLRKNGTDFHTELRKAKKGESKFIKLHNPNP